VSLRQDKQTSEAAKSKSRTAH